MTISNYTRRFLLCSTLGLSLLGLGIGHAHAHRCQEGGAKIYKQLDLSDTQKSQLKEIRRHFKEQAKTLRQDSSLSKDARHEAMFKLRHEKRSQVDAILSREQRETRDRLRSEHHAKRQEKRLQKMTKALELSDSQVQKIRDIKAKGHAQAQALRDDKSLDHEAKRAKFKAMRQEMRSSIVAVLTPEQAERFGEMKAKRRAKRGRRHGGGHGHHGGF